MFYGGSNIIAKPTRQEEREIINKQKERKEKEMHELSIDSDDDPARMMQEEEEEEREEDVRIRNAIDWKRRHFFIACLAISLFLMIKLEFSYTAIFGNNILIFLVAFNFMDIAIEQVLTRIIMGEALLVSPVLGYLYLH